MKALQKKYRVPKSLMTTLLGHSEAIRVISLDFSLVGKV